MSLRVEATYPDGVVKNVLVLPGTTMEFTGAAYPQLGNRILLLCCLSNDEQGDARLYDRPEDYQSTEEDVAALIESTTSANLVTTVQHLGTRTLDMDRFNGAGKTGSRITISHRVELAPNEPAINDRVYVNFLIDRFGRTS